MLRRWHVLVLIVVTLAAFCVLAAAKLRATPKYDRVQIGMLEVEVEAVLGEPTSCFGCESMWRRDEGVIWVRYRAAIVPGSDAGGALPLWRYAAAEKSIDRRGPLERLAWLAGWQEQQGAFRYVY